MTIVVALPAEARPLRQRLGLRPASRHPGERRFLGRAGRVSLLISGVGKDAVAACVAAAGRPAAAGGRRASAWLNVGIAGHRDAAPGTMFLAHKIVEATSGTAWFPPILFDPGCPTAGVVTVDRACHDYPETVLYDMEAAAFYRAAVRHASRELVQSVKIVSDNAASPPLLLRAEEVERLIEPCAARVALIVDRLAGLAGDLAGRTGDPPAYRELLERYHFTTTQRRRLRSLLRRWTAVRRDADALEQTSPGGRPPADARHLLQSLEDAVDDVSLRLEGRR